MVDILSRIYEESVQKKGETRVKYEKIVFYCIFTLWGLDYQISGKFSISSEKLPLGLRVNIYLSIDLVVSAAIYLFWCLMMSNVVSWHKLGGGEGCE